MTVVFIVGVAISAAFQSAEIVSPLHTFAENVRQPINNVKSYPRSPLVSSL